MHKRRWIVLGIALSFFTVLALVFRLAWKAGDDTVGLAFIGYTNLSLTVTGNIPQATNSGGASEAARYVLPVAPGSEMAEDMSFVIATKALLLLTNRGSVAIQVVAAISSASFGAPAFATPLGTGLPRVLKPGESMVIEAGIDPIGEPWWTEVGYLRCGWRERFCSWAWNSGNPTIQARLNRLLPDLEFVPSGLITNLPPQGSRTFRPFRWSNPQPKDLRF